MCVCVCVCEKLTLKRDNVKYLIPRSYLLNELKLPFTTKITDFIIS